MANLVTRSEDIKDEEILDFYVDTKRDEEIISSLKGASPVLLEGARGVGKSFLLRVTEQKLLERLGSNNILPVYVDLTRSILLHTSNREQFRYWTLAKLSKKLVRTLRKNGLAVDVDREVNILHGSDGQADPINSVIKQFEESYGRPGKQIDVSEVPGVAQFRYAVEDICEKLGLERIVVLFDEAAHLLQPDNQRQFFSLFRDLRTPYISCNAAVYPGITSYGSSFERSHDATVERIERDVRKDSYVREMEKIVTFQSDSHIHKNIRRKSDNFKTISYAASGNPRYMLKILSQNPDLTNVVEGIKDYFRNKVWKDHSDLSNKFNGLTELVEWGEQFIKRDVLPNLKERNEDSDTTSRYFWVQDGAPEFVTKSLQLLMYTGIVSIDKESIIATNNWRGTRYAMNLGVMFSEASLPIQECLHISYNLSVSKYLHFNNQHTAFSDLRGLSINIEGQDNELLREMLKRPVSDLDLTYFKKTRIREQGLDSIGDVLESSESLLKEGYYIGDVRARKIHNAAQAAVMEYLLG